MREKPILFSGEMVKAILDERKTKTRRVIKPQPQVWSKSENILEWKRHGSIFHLSPEGLIAECPYGIPGDLLWVRESYRFGQAPNDDEGQGIALYADNSYRCHPDLSPSREHWCRVWKKRPSIFMPRWASRITLRVTGVRVERLQEMRREDAEAEGIGDSPLWRPAFKQLWDSINDKRGYDWDSNPWVWVVEFAQVDA